MCSIVAAKWLEPPTDLIYCTVDRRRTLTPCVYRPWVAPWECKKLRAQCVFSKSCSS